MSEAVDPMCEHMFVSYVELHCHSAFSFLDGASLPEELVVAALERGHQALALTDHNSVSGSMEFAQAASSLGLRAIHGAEVDLVDPATARAQREGAVLSDAEQAARWTGHVTLLVRDGLGWRNLCRLLTRAHAHTREIVGPAARARAGADGRRPRRARRGPGLPVGLRGPWRPRRADRPRAAGGLRARRVPDRAAAPVSPRRPGAQPRAGRAGRTARGAVRRDGQRPRPRAGARAAAGRARGGPRAHDAGRLRAAATRQPHARAHDAGGDGGALRGPPRRGGRDRAPGRHADLRPHRRPRLPLPGGRGRRGRPQARRGVRRVLRHALSGWAAACGPLRPRGWTRSWR